MIPRDSDRTDLAHQFINYMQEPKVAAASSNYLRYASANKDASPFIDSSLVKDTRIYPGPEVRAKCAFLKEIGRFEVSKVHWWKILDTASKRAG